MNPAKIIGKVYEYGRNCGKDPGNINPCIRGHYSNQIILDKWLKNLLEASKLKGHTKVKAVQCIFRSIVKIYRTGIKIISSH